MAEAWLPASWSQSYVFSCESLKVWFVGWWDLHWVFTGLLLRSIFRIGNVPTWWEGRSQLDLDSNRSFATRQTVSYLSAMTNCVGGIAAELLFESLSNCTGPPVRQIKKTFATKTFPKQARDILWECSATGATATPLKICRWQFPGDSFWREILSRRKFFGWQKLTSGVSP